MSDTEELNKELFTGEVFNAVDTKPWLNFYEKNVPENLDYPDVTLYERLMQSVEKFPDSIAWEFSLGA